jgi:tRNA nucleotidyltransferase (CCA-adding enzyme)
MEKLDVAQIPADVLGVCQRLTEAGFAAHLVGGGVRDLLIGRVPNDFDVATDALPDRVLKLFGQRFAIPTGLQHGTITVVTGTPPNQRHVEVTTYRGEGAYLDGRRPSTVTFSATLVEDLSRRDFTINAIAFDPQSRLLTDPFDGQGDIDRKLIRAVGDAVLRFTEDGLRPMRAVRQATQLGFEIDPPTLSAIAQTLDSFRMVAMERIHDELIKLLAANKPGRGIELLRISGLLQAILPELLEGIGCAQNRDHQHDVYHHVLAVLDEVRSRDPLVRMGALLHDIAKPRARIELQGQPGEYSFEGHERLGSELADEVCKRLKMSKSDRERVVAMVGQHMFHYAPEWTDGAVRRFVQRVGRANLGDVFELREADVAGRGHGQPRDAETGALRARIAAVVTENTALSIRDLAINGQDVMRILGVSGGRVVGQVVEKLLDRVLDDPSVNTREALLGLVPELAATSSLAP